MEGASGGGYSQDLFQALIKAKTKNILEEIKLQKVLELLELQRRHQDKMHFNTIFEQKKAVYRLKLETLLRKLPEEESREVKQHLSDAFPESPVPRYPTENVDVVSGPTRNHDFCRQSCGQEAQAFDSTTFSSVPDKSFEKHDSKALLVEYQHGSTAGRCTRERRRERHSGDFATDIERLLKQERGEFGRSSKQQQPEAGPGISRIKTLPELQWKKDAMKSKSRTQDRKTDARTRGSNIRKLYVAGHWVGDPKAIASVRRARKPPEELVARHHHKAVGEIRRLLNEMPGFSDCSRSCQRHARIDNVQSTLQSLPPVRLDATQLNILKKKAASLEVSDFTACTRQNPFTRSVPEITVVSQPVLDHHKKWKIRKEINQLEQAAKVDFHTGGPLTRSWQPPTLNTKSLLEDFSKIRVGGGYSQRYT